MKRNLLLLAAICSCYNLFAEEVIVKQFRYAGPYEVKEPFLKDSLDVNSKKFTEKELLKTVVPFNNVRQSTQLLETNADGESTLPAGNQSAHIGLASFYLNSDRYVKGALQVKGPETYEVYVNNEKQTAPDGKVSLSLEPHRYEIVIKYLAESDKAGTLKVSFDTERGCYHGYHRSGKKIYDQRRVRRNTFPLRQPLPQRKISAYLLSDYLSRRTDCIFSANYR